MMRRLASVSICIVNHNYGRFLDDAIASALAQTHPAVEVLVVDDGSTDDSRARLARWRERVRVLEQPNLGHAAAVNRAWGEARGDLVFFLDSDDVLAPEAAARAASALDAQPALSRVQFRMQVTDSALRPIGYTPSRRGVLADGDLGAHMLRFRNYPWAPGSANAYHRERLRRVMPMDPEAYRESPDVYLAELTPLLGPIRSIDDPLVRYRMHGQNAFLGHGVDQRWLHRKIGLTIAGHARMLELARERGLPVASPDPLAPLDVAFLGYRLASLLLAPDRHPVPEDRRPRLAVRGIEAAVRNPFIRRPEVLRRGLWFAALGLVPRRLARRLAQVWVPDTQARPRLLLALRRRRLEERLRRADGA